MNDVTFSSVRLWVDEETNDELGTLGRFYLTSAISYTLLLVDLLMNSGLVESHTDRSHLAFRHLFSLALRKKNDYKHSTVLEDSACQLGELVLPCAIPNDNKINVVDEIIT